MRDAKCGSPMENKKRQILIVGGGTGGHIYPAIAIGRELAKIAPDIGVTYICGDKEIERMVYEQQGISPIVLKVPQMRKRRVLNVAKLVSAVIEARRIIKKLKPEAIVGTGGYTSAPVFAAGLMTRTRIFVQEQNTIAGMTNKFFSRFAECCFVAFEQTRESVKSKEIIVTGNPLRFERFDYDKGESRIRFDLDQHKRVIVVCGGSQGAQGINSLMCEFIKEWSDKELIKSETQILWSTGVKNFEKVMAELPRKEYVQKNIKVVPLIEKMHYAYSAADLVISRAGALALSEMAGFGCAAILIPFPYATNNHQWHNANSYASENAAILIEQCDATSQALYETVEALFSDPQRLKILSENMRSLAKTDAAKTIAEKIARVVN